MIDLHSVTQASQNVSGDDSSVSTYGTQFTQRLSQTKIGTARVRDMDFFAPSANTSNTSHSHSDYILYLYDIRTSNSKTGTVADSNTSTTTIKVGSNSYFTDSAGAVAANTLFPRLAQENSVYDGATITVTTPILNKLIGEELAATSGTLSIMADPNPKRITTISVLGSIVFN